MSTRPSTKIDPVKAAAAVRMTPIGVAKPLQEATGAIPAAEDTSVAKLTEAHAELPQIQPIQRQTHGAMPAGGAITSVAQLIRGGKNISRGSAGSFGTLDEYKEYLSSLSLGELHRHALEEAKIVPIDDRGRLMRRLEGEWGAIAARTSGRGQQGYKTPQPKQFSQEQVDAQEKIRNKLLRR